MRIVRRDWVRPTNTMAVWLIPTVAYTLEKLVGVIKPDREWVWWIMLPSVFLVWLVANFRIDKRK